MQNGLENLHVVHTRQNILSSNSAVDIIITVPVVVPGNWRMDMTVVKSNLCPTCGGLLSIDLDKQVYVCPFCGVTFDYEYFREDDVKDTAAKAISRGEYGSAKDAYDFMLTKDPHDFEALRGRFICENKWQNMNVMKDDREVNVSPDEPTLLKAIGDCLPEHKAYFEKVREALSELDHYKELTAEAENITKERSSEQKALNDLNYEYIDNSRQFTMLLDDIMGMDSKERDAIITLMVVIPLAVLALIIFNKAWTILIIFASLIVLAIAVYNIVKAATAKHLRAKMDPYKKKVEELHEQYKAKHAEAMESRSRYRELVQEFMDIDPLPSKEEPADPSSTTEPE